MESVQLEAENTPSMEHIHFNDQHSLIYVALYIASWYPVWK